MSDDTGIIRLKAITLWQPWAQFIAEGWKTIETRTHSRFQSLAGSTIAIHAGAQWDHAWKQLAGPYLTPGDIAKVDTWTAIRPAVICLATIGKTGWIPPTEENSYLARINCQTRNRYGLFIEQVHQVGPITMPGHQGIWECTIDVAQEIGNQMIKDMKEIEHQGLLF